MKLIPIIISALLLVVTNACIIKNSDRAEGDYANEEIHDEGNYTVEEAPPMANASEYGKYRNLPKFNGLLHAISGNVVWKQGDQQKVEIHAVPEVLKEIVTEVKEGGLLYLGYRTRGFRQGDNKVYVFITTPDIKAIRLSGSGNIQSKNRWEVSDLSLAVSGSGNFDLKVDAKKVMTELTGSGNVKLKGSADVHTIDVRGSGQVLCQRLKVDVCQVDVNGSGFCKLNVSDQLNATVNGSGSVLYQGNPQVSKSINGSGSVVQQ